MTAVQKALQGSETKELHEETKESKLLAGYFGKFEILIFNMKCFFAPSAVAYSCSKEGKNGARRLLSV